MIDDRDDMDDDMIVIICGPKRPRSAPVRRVFRWLVCAFVLVICAYSATYILFIMERAGIIHYAH